MRYLILFVVMVFASSVLSYSSEDIFPGLTSTRNDATQHTIGVNQSYYSLLDFDDDTEFDLATRGLLIAPESLEIRDSTGKVIWSQKAYEFLGDYYLAPDTVNPSLWRNTLLNHHYGLFEVVEGIYQVRGYDFANITFVETRSGGWILMDTGMSIECAKAAKQLVDEYFGPRPILAIIISHTHIDHFGGMAGVVDKTQVADRHLSIMDQLDSGKIPIIVPQGFAQHAISENVYAGSAMARRATYQYGTFLDIDEKGKMALGIGLAQSVGTTSFIMPTHEISYTGETIIIDGVEMQFQLTPGTEAPAEMNTYFPQFGALWMAENCNATLHNLYTLRGAEVRDAVAWAKYLLEAIQLYGKEAEVVFHSHNWPRWGNDEVIMYLENTAAVYKFIHDQTLLYISLGYTSDEISNMIALPEYFEQFWYTRGYYGTLAHNSKAVYQKYMGWYDANPVNLNPLEPTDRARKLVEYLGDTQRVLELAYEDFLAGEYQWVAEITNILVFADPDNIEARLLCAAALEQLGYQAESGTWRSAYLSGAKELREGVSKDWERRATASVDILMNMTSEMLLDYLAVVIDSKASEEVNLCFNLILTDTQERYFVHWYHGVLLYYNGRTEDDADATFTCPRIGLAALIAKDWQQIDYLIRSEGDRSVLNLIADAIVSADRFFNIVEPKIQ